MYPTTSLRMSAWEATEPLEYFDPLMVALELSYLQLTVFVLIDLSLAHMACPQQLYYLLDLASSLFIRFRDSELVSVPVLAY